MADPPHLPRQALIDAHGVGGFRFAGMSHRGSLLCLPDGIWAWPVTASAQLTDDLFALVFARADVMDFFVLGTGDAPWIMPGSLRGQFREAHISVDTMTTGPAVRTYNVLLMEGRRVGAGLIAIVTSLANRRGGKMASCRMHSPIARRWSAMPTGTALSHRCSRRRSIATHCSRSMPSLSKLGACARRRVKRCRAKSASNGGARFSAGERGGEAAGNPVAGALLGTIERYSLPANKLAELIEAHRFDLYDEPMATVAELETYTTQTSSAMIGLAAQILGTGTDAAAERAGIADGLTALMRAFPVHAARRQLYLPAELLERHGVRVNDIFAGRSSDGLIAPHSPNCGAWRAAISILRTHACWQCPMRRSRLFSPSPWCGRRSIVWSAAMFSRPATSHRGGGSG